MLLLLNCPPVDRNGVGLFKPGGRILRLGRVLSPQLESHAQIAFTVSSYGTLLPTLALETMAGKCKEQLKVLAPSVQDTGQNDERRLTDQPHLSEPAGCTSHALGDIRMKTQVRR